MTRKFLIENFLDHISPQQSCLKYPRLQYAVERKSNQWTLNTKDPLKIDTRDMAVNINEKRPDLIVWSLSRSHRLHPRDFVGVFYWDNFSLSWICVQSFQRCPLFFFLLNIFVDMIWFQLPAHTVLFCVQVRAYVCMCVRTRVRNTEETARSQLYCSLEMMNN